MAGFPLFADNHVQQVLLEGLRRRGWDAVRAIDVHPERTPDAVLFEHAAHEGRVFVSNDRGFLKRAAAWLKEGRSFAGLVFWPQEDYAAMTTGEIVSAFEALAAEEAPFAYPVRHISPAGRAQVRERFKREG